MLIGPFRRLEGPSEYFRNLIDAYGLFFQAFQRFLIGSSKGPFGAQGRGHGPMAPPSGSTAVRKAIGFVSLVTIRE